VWDSFIGRISVELCGNLTQYALHIGSTGDTTNATHIASVQCEQAYHKGIFANLLRFQIDNIHSERLAVLTADEGSGGFLNHYFLLSNSSIGQAVLDVLTTGTAPDGTALASTKGLFILNGDTSAFCEFNCIANNVRTDYGTRLAIRNLSCFNYTQKSPAIRVVLELPQIGGVCSLEQNVTLIEPAVTTFTPAINAKNLVVQGGTITNPLNFTNNIVGNVVFNEVALNGVQETKSPTTGFLPTTLNFCTSPTFVGAFNAKCRVNGGWMGVVSLASRSLADFRGVDFTSFTYTGDTGFITRECTGPVASTWTVPLTVAYPAGTMTERVGYNAAGKIYQNTDGANSWAVV
jgi:hypothetical protein